MQLDFTAEQDELRESVRSVLERECPASRVRQIVESGDHSGAMELWRTMVSLDWPALTVPEELGGLGLGYAELAVVVEELGRVIAPGPYLPTVCQFLPAVRAAAKPDQAAHWLKRLAAGEITGTVAVAEDAGTWALDEVGALARPSGDGFVLSGRKRHVVEVEGVDEVVVAARLEGTRGAEGLVLAVVDAGALGIQAVASFDRSRRVATVTLDNVSVTSDRVLGEPGSEAVGAALTRALEEATVAQALEVVGACQTIFDTTLAYAKERHQFGVPIGSFQAVKHKLANMFVALERARAMCYFAAATIAEDDDRRALAASMAKAAAGDCQRMVAADGIQLLGGIGYTWEHDQHLFVKRAKAGEILFGSAPFHRGRVADTLGI